MDNYICQECGKAFISNAVNVKFCSRQCRNRHGKRKGLAEEFICTGCGKTFHPKARDRTKYCSRECAFEHKKAKPKTIIKKPIKKPICIICGKEFEGKSWAKYCSDYCRSMTPRLIKTKPRKIRQKYEIDCAICGTKFISEHANAKYCSDKCRNYIENRTKEISRRHKLKDNGKIDYSISLPRLIKRDKGICHICGMKVNMKVHSNHDEYGSIDHIMPVSKGGTHTWDNVKLAHRGCNTSKSNKLFYEVNGGQITMCI